MSVRPSVTRVLCDKTINNALQIFLYHTKRIITLVFLTATGVGERRPLPFKIWAQSDPPPSKHAHFDRFPLIMSQP